MVKSTPSLGRIAAMVIFALSCFGLLLFLWLAFGGSIPLKPKGYRFQASFAEATQLAKEADVRISGVPVGKVKTIEPDTKTGRTTAVIELESRYAPVKSDAKAMLRQKTLLGETYVELTPGTPDAEPVAENGTLAQTQVSPTVELDEILRAFDPKTRRAWQTWMQAQAQGIDGYGQDINDALGNLGPFAEDTATLVDILNRQEGGVSRLISNTGVVFEALTERQGQLRSLIRNSNQVFATTASRDEALKEAFVALPTFEDESRVTLRRLAEFATDTDPLVDQLRPAARELSPTLIDLSALAPDLKKLFIELNPLIDASKAGFPAAQQVLRGPAPAAGADRPGGEPARPDPGLRRDLQARAQRLLRQRHRRHAGPLDRHPRALPAHDEPAQPGEPRGLSAPDRHQPAERVHEARCVRRAARRARGLRGPPLRPRRARHHQRRELPCADGAHPAAARPPRAGADAAADHRSARGAGTRRAAGPDQQVRVRQRARRNGAGAAVQEAGALYLRW